ADHPSHADRRRGRRRLHAVGAAPRAGAGGEHHPDRRAERPVRPLQPHRRRQRCGDGAGGGGRVQRPRLHGGGAARRPPEPSGRGLQHRTAMARPGRRGHDPRRADLLRRARRRRRGPGEEQGLRQRRRRLLRPHRHGLRADHRALGVRHLHAGQVHRRRDGQGGRGHLVLHHRRLRLRPRAGARHHQLRPRRGRQGAGQRPDALPWDLGLLLLPGAGAGEPGQGGGPRQRGAGHDQLHQAGGRVRADAPRHQAGGAADVRGRRPRPRPPDRAGTGDDRELLLGPERPHAGADPTRPLAADGQPAAQHGHCRQLLRRAALPEGRPGHGRPGGQGLGHGRHQPHEGHADRRRRLRPGLHPAGRPAPDAGLPLRGEKARGIARRLGLPQPAANDSRGGSMATHQRGRLPSGAQL
ncbi:MAG: ABC transporter, substrate-binding protein (cluster 4, leucine/isoleucine/valine/benzoate), partial [uncultured Acetobacteraceae bacterium]